MHLPALLLLPLSLLPLLSSAHMAMEQPVALRHKQNPFSDPAKIDYDMVSPLLPSGANYPCKGYHVDLGTPQGQSVATYQAGGSYEVKLSGSATHMGGSCQISLSYDRGRSWSVIKSFIGNCVRPNPGGPQTFPFRIPNSAPSGENVLLAWTWFNQQGNREMYMNCAVVTIRGGLFGRSVGKVLGKRNVGPPMFVANVGNGCSTPSGTDLVFPNPGGNVEYGGDTAKRSAPVGENCGSGSGGFFGGMCDQKRVIGFRCSDAAGIWGRGTLLGAGTAAAAAVVVGAM